MVKLGRCLSIYKGGIITAEQIKNVTKDRILRVAAKLFAERGYERVTTREIANAVHINPASIYYHFPSKEAILKSLYQFYSAERRKARPNLDELLRLAETVPPHELLTKIAHVYDKDLQELLNQILVIAAQDITIDSKSEYFIREIVFETTASLFRPLFERMIVLDKIKPFDIDSFLRVLSYYCFSAAALNKSPFKCGETEYRAGLALLFSLIEATGK